MSERRSSPVSCGKGLCRGYETCEAMISFQVAAPKVNNTMAHLVDRNGFWIMVTLCIGRVALLNKIMTVLEMKQSSASLDEL